MKFKDGDMVRILEGTELDGDPRYEGVGTIVRSENKKFDYPIMVQWPSSDISPDRKINWFKEKELVRSDRYIKKHGFKRRG